MVSMWAVSPAVFVPRKKNPERDSGAHYCGGINNVEDGHGGSPPSECTMTPAVPRRIDLSQRLRTFAE